jgi:hypothetical protein
MKSKGNPIYYSVITEELLCSLCGKHGDIRFKDFAVCEDCLEYVKTCY